MPQTEQEKKNQGFIPINILIGSHPEKRISNLNGATVSIFPDLFEERNRGIKVVGVVPIDQQTSPPILINTQYIRTDDPVLQEKFGMKPIKPITQ